MGQFSSTRFGPYRSTTLFRTYVSATFSCIFDFDKLISQLPTFRRIFYDEYNGITQQWDLHRAIQNRLKGHVGWFDQCPAGQLQLTQITFDNDSTDSYICDSQVWN